MEKEKEEVKTKSNQWAIGDRYKHLLCKECKAKIIELSGKLTKLDMLRPKKTSQRFVNAVCFKCRSKIIKNIKNGK